MENKTVILTTLNEAWAVPGSIFDLFLESFRRGYHTRRLLNHLVVVAFDQKAYSRCMSVHSYCFALTTDGVDFSGEKLFMTPGYLKMMWRRIDFLRIVLEKGYNFIFSVIPCLCCCTYFLIFMMMFYLLQYSTLPNVNNKLIMHANFTFRH